MTRAILVIEGDSDRLEAEGHTEGIDRLLSLCRPLIEAGHLRLTHLKLGTTVDVDFWTAVASHGHQYDGVFVIAHANAKVVAAAHNFDMGWDEAARVLALVRPRVVLLAACQGISAGPATALFDSVPTLELVGGSPTTLTVSQVCVAFCELLFSVFDHTLDAGLSLLATVYNAIETGGVVVWRRREPFKQATDQQLFGEDIVAVCAKILLDAESAPQPRRRVPRRSSRKLGNRSVAHGRRG